RGHATAADPARRRTPRSAARHPARDRGAVRTSRHSGASDLPWGTAAVRPESEPRSAPTRLRAPADCGCGSGNGLVAWAVGAGRLRWRRPAARRQTRTRRPRRGPPAALPGSGAGSTPPRASRHRDAGAVRPRPAPAGVQRRVRCRRGWPGPLALAPDRASARRRSRAPAAPRRSPPARMRAIPASATWVRVAPSGGGAELLLQALLQRIVQPELARKLVEVGALHEILLVRCDQAGQVHLGGDLGRGRAARDLGRI